MKETRNLIVGGGLLGLLTAWYLAKAGETSVICERQAVGQESSWAGGGILSPLYPHKYLSLRPLVSRSVVDYPHLVEDIRKAAGIDPELIISGLLVLDGKDNEDAEEMGAHNVARSDIARLEPELYAPEPHAAYYETVSQVRNPRFMCALRQTLSKLGVRFLEHTIATGFLATNGRLHAIQTVDGDIETENCIVTAGAWTGKLMKSVCLPLPIEPVRGQMIVFNGSPALIHHILVYKYRYLIPRADGRILAGSTVERVGFDKSTTQEARQTLYEAAVRLVPALARAPIEAHWAGLRPGSPDGLPFIGQHPGVSGLFVCSGHHRNGFATGPASAQLVVDLMLGHKPVIDPTPYRLDRPAVPWND